MTSVRIQLKTQGFPKMFDSNFFSKRLCFLPVENCTSRWVENGYVSKKPMFSILSCKIDVFNGYYQSVFQEITRKYNKVLKDTLKLEMRRFGFCFSRVMATSAKTSTSVNRVLVIRTQCARTPLVRSDADASTASPGTELTPVNPPAAV